MIPPPSRGDKIVFEITGHLRDLLVWLRLASLSQSDSWRDSKVRIWLTWKMAMDLTRFHNPVMRTLDGLRMILDSNSELYKH